jgi:hypothetical protein
MSDGGRGRTSLGVEMGKSSQKWSPRRSAVRSIAWLDVWRCGPLMLAYVAVVLGGGIDSPVRHGAAWMAQTDEPKIPAPLSGHNSGLPVQDAFVA